MFVMRHNTYIFKIVAMLFFFHWWNKTKRKCLINVLDSLSNIGLSSAHIKSCMHIKPARTVREMNNIMLQESQNKNNSTSI